MLPWWVFAIGSAIFVALIMILKKKILFKEHAMQFEAVHRFFMFLIVFLFIPYVKAKTGRTYIGTGCTAYTFSSYPVPLAGVHGPVHYF